MPTTKPRVNVALERPLYREIRELANQNGVSLSLEIRDLLREALEIFEDQALDRWASERARSFHPQRALSHETVWKHLARPQKS